MKKNKFWSIMLMLMLTLGTSVVFTSCGGSDDDEFVPTEGNKDEGSKDEGSKDDGKKEDGLPEDKTPAGVEAVDLGLPSGVKWASCNIGATKPEERGDYFAWGETIGYHYPDLKSFEWLTYKWCSNGEYSGLTKYTFPDNVKTGIWYDGDNFIGDNKTTLSLTGKPDEIDDAARANWGGKWRMPTKKDAEELIKYCDWHWETLNGCDGMKITSKMNGKSIFMRAAGYCSKRNYYFLDSKGDYWLSSLIELQSTGADKFFFNSGNADCSIDSRYYGLSVRAVCE